MKHDRVKMAPLRLSELIHYWVPKHREGDRVDCSKVAESITEDLGPEERDRYCQQHIADRVKSSLKKGATVPAQMSLALSVYKLQAVQVVEGQAHVTKATDALILDEFMQAIRMRESQISADQHEVDLMKKALADLRVVWSNDPMMTFREAHEAAVTLRERE